MVKEMFGLLMGTRKNLKTLIRIINASNVKSADFEISKEMWGNTFVKAMDPLKNTIL